MQTLELSKNHRSKLPQWLEYISKSLNFKDIFENSERYPDENDNLEKLLEVSREKAMSSINFLIKLGIPENQVVLSTRHSAKGLEFNAVIMLGMEQDSFPHYRSKTPEELAEARRICFVAVTRARKTLILIRSKQLYGQVRKAASKRAFSILDRT